MIRFVLYHAMITASYRQQRDLIGSGGITGVRSDIWWWSTGSVTHLYVNKLGFVGCMCFNEIKQKQMKTRLWIM